MSDNKQLDIRQALLLYKTLFHNIIHIPGDEDIKVSCAAENGKPLLICPAVSQRGKEGESGRTKTKT